MGGASHYDVIVVGGGASGAVLAARLGEQGRKRVLVLEAGSDPCDPSSDPGTGRSLKEDYEVPAFHPFASENEAMAEDVWVRHYSNDEQQSRDWKYDKEKGGVLYPRNRGLGGCSAHHAMIIVKPNDRDWNHIAETMFDASWNASNMENYWQRVERCRHRLFLWRWLEKLTGWNPTGHGWWGWMQTEWAMPIQVLFDRKLRNDIIRSIGAAADAFQGNASDFTVSQLDCNARRVWGQHASGVRIPAMSTRNHTRFGAREHFLSAKTRAMGRIELLLRAAVTRVDVQDEKARGVFFTHEGAEKYASADEIVLAGGVYHTPQLMMLSGMGDPEQLSAHGIEMIANLPGVGRNMQDRYEVGIVSEMQRDWRALRKVEYSPNDRMFWWWKNFRNGTYKSNGTIFSVELKSRPEMAVPDLFCFSLLVDFQGYYKGYSERIRTKNYLTWAILKAYTNNTAGTVRLQSADPSDPVDIQFHYFEEGSDGWEEDLDAVVTGVHFVRKIADSLSDHVAAEAAPGRMVSTNEDIKGFVRDNAWGHHACGTCAMKPVEDGGVVDSRFRVHGIEGLRIVDASVFPRIPGYFLVSACYMIAEKAADTMLEDMATRN